MNHRQVLLVQPGSPRKGIHTHNQGPVFTDGACKHRGILVFMDWHRFACHRCFIDACRTRDYRAVYRNGLTAAYMNLVANGKVAELYFDVDTILANHPYRFSTSKQAFLEGNARAGVYMLLHAFRNFQQKHDARCGSIIALYERHGNGRCVEHVYRKPAFKQLPESIDYEGDRAC